MTDLTALDRIGVTNRPLHDLRRVKLLNQHATSRARSMRHSLEELSELNAPDTPTGGGSPSAGICQSDG